MTNLASPIPADDPARSLAVANPDIAKGRYVSVAGGTYTILLSGEETGGRYCLIDMRVPDGGGPPPHRHDFEEMFTILEGTLEFSFRGDTQTVNAGTTVNIPANAPHAFKNTSGSLDEVRTRHAAASMQGVCLQKGGTHRTIPHCNSNPTDGS